LRSTHKEDDLFELDLWFKNLETLKSGSFTGKKVLALFHDAPGVIRFKEEAHPVHCVYLRQEDRLDDLSARIVHEVLNAEQNDTLFIAAQEGRLPDVERFLLAHATVDQEERDGRTPLWTAAYHGHLEVVEALLKAGADVNKATFDGSTPLHVALEKGHLDVALSLILAHADVKSVTTWRIPQPFYIPPAVKACLDSVAGEGYIFSMLNILSLCGIREAPYFPVGTTPLHLAAREGYLLVAQVLCSVGADLHSKDANGNTAMDIARMRKHTEMVDFLTDPSLHPLEVGAEATRAELIAFLTTPPPRSPGEAKLPSLFDSGTVPFHRRSATEERTGHGVSSDGAVKTIGPEGAFP
jgi:hypothetical protein